MCHIKTIQNTHWYKIIDKDKAFYTILVEGKPMIVSKKCVKTISDEEYMIEEL